VIPFLFGAGLLIASILFFLGALPVPATVPACVGAVLMGYELERGER